LARLGELFKALTGNLWKFVYAWILPTCLAVGAFWIAIVPRLPDTPIGSALARLGAESALAAGLAVSFAIIAIAVLLSVNASPLSRLLEGYLMPRPIYEIGREVQRRRRKQLQDEFDAEQDPVRKGLLSEQLALFPENPDHVTPTRYGNAVASIETYSSRRFGFDYHTFSYELRTMASESVRKELEDAEAVVNFFLASVHLSAAFGLTALALGAVQGDTALCVAGLVSLVLTRFFYLRAIDSTLTWGRMVRVLVHLVRGDVLKAYGLVPPAKLVEERLLWLSMYNLVYFGDKEDPSSVGALERVPKVGQFGAILDQHRAVDDAPPNLRPAAWQ
jgi:hypothetical protein